MPRKEELVIRLATFLLTKQNGREKALLCYLSSTLWQGSATKSDKVPFNKRPLLAIRYYVYKKNIIGSLLMHVLSREVYRHGAWTNALHENSPLVTSFHRRHPGKMFRIRVIFFRALQSKHHACICKTAILRMGSCFFLEIRILNNRVQTYSDHAMHVYLKNSNLLLITVHCCFRSSVSRCHANQHW